jgi:hypothetical protein
MKKESGEPARSLMVLQEGGKRTTDCTAQQAARQTGWKGTTETSVEKNQCAADRVQIEEEKV